MGLFSPHALGTFAPARAERAASSAVAAAAARIFAGVYAAASFAYFASVGPDTLDRAVLRNALTDGEQQTLVRVICSSIAAASACVAALIIAGRHRATRDRARILIDASYEAFLLVPLGLWPVYEASVASHVRMFVIAAMTALAGVSLHLFVSRSPRAYVVQWIEARSVARRAPFAIAAAGIAHGALLARLGSSRFAVLSSGWDLAINTQVHWNILTTFVPSSTMYTDQTINHYGIHFSPILHLTSLVLLVHRSPVALIWLLNLALGAGAWAVYALMKCLTGRTSVGLLFAIGYLLNPSVHGIALHEFHEIGLFVPLMLALAWAVESGRGAKLVWLLVVAVLSIREDAPAYVLVYAGWLWLSGRRALAKPLGVVAGGYLVLVHALVMPWLRGGSPYVFDDRYAGLVRAGASGKSAIAETILTNLPYTLGYVVSSPEKWQFVALVLMPVAFLPLASRHAFVLLVPGLAFSLLSSFGPHCSTEFHYTAPLLPFIYVASGVALRRIETARPRMSFVLAGAAFVATVLLAGKLGKSPLLNGRAERKLAEQAAVYGDTAKAIHAAARTIPNDDRCVRATNNLLPLVAERRRAYIAPWGSDCDWALIDYARDARHAPSTYETEREWLSSKLRSGAYGIRYLDERVVLIGRGEPQDLVPPLLARLDAEALTPP